MDALTACLGWILLAALPSNVDANGGTLRLGRATSGPYLVSAWTRPEPPRVGRLDLSVAIMTPDTQRAVLDAEARASATLLTDPTTMTTTRLERGTGGIPLLYHGNLEVPAAGPYRVLIQSSGPAGSGEAAFEVDIQPPLPVAAPLALGLAALGAGGALWWAWTRRRARQG
jgi:hypothetical protein